ncbi:family 2 glycosyl transferase [Candidatus Omnitrophus magneticus]|uniref:Family 2 glycosyl transferase n=1 Tax=Candidatus Omnitrophus magneticus TaxID=1609969 RepID=A0A0F0CNU8_9BACT|nr:family 2 glycosyl transferase [Candidatus Omnitrophus magneticus]
MNKKNNIAIMGVIFPLLEKYLHDALDSFNSQTKKDFDVILLNDGFKNIEAYKSKYDLNIIEVSVSGTPAEIRFNGLKMLKSAGYENIIFADMDDFYSENRVEKTSEFLKNFDIVINDLTVMFEHGDIEPAYLSRRIKDMTPIDLSFVMNKNICGFTNTAIRTSCLKELPEFNKNLTAVDWYLYSYLIKSGVNAVFTDETTSFYRIYEGNTTGLNGVITEKKIERGIEAKLSNYAALSAYDLKWHILFDRFLAFSEKMKDGSYKKKYFESVKNISIFHPFWWEEIKLPEELNL